ncbi:MAG: glycosyltransferase, partial [Chloroflexi bacterium]|nr:glycosyltransferase [Chloroflexota bacterium]
VPGREPSKSRLAADLGTERSDWLYQACLLDVVEAAIRSTWARVVVCHSPPEDGGAFREWLDGAASEVSRELAAADRLSLLPQQGCDLGDRLARAGSWSLAQGFTKAAIVGSDIPGLDARRLDECRVGLSDVDAVFGPALDGGFYLFGANWGALERHGCGTDLPSQLFTGITWGQQDTLQQILAAARPYRLNIDLLAPWPDLDSAADLPAIVRVVGAYRAVGRTLAPRLWPFIQPGADFDDR